MCTLCKEWILYENCGLDGKFDRVRVEKTDVVCRGCKLDKKLEEWTCSMHVWKSEIFEWKNDLESRCVMMEARLVAIDVRMTSVEESVMSNHCRSVELGMNMNEVQMKNGEMMNVIENNMGVLEVRLAEFDDKRVAGMSESVIGLDGESEGESG